MGEYVKNNDSQEVLQVGHNGWCWHVVLSLLLFFVFVLMFSWLVFLGIICFLKNLIET